MFGMSTPTRILAIDDHALFRESLVRLLECEPDFQVVAQCESVTRAMELLNCNAIDLVLLDYELGEESGASLMRQIKRWDERAKVLIVTGGISDANIVHILGAGASGVFFKKDKPSRLIEAIRRISQGEIWLDDNSLRSLLAASGKQVENAAPESPLSLRQHQVLSGILDGLSNKEIAWNLNVSMTTIKVAIQQLFERAGVRSRSQLVRITLEKHEGDWLSMESTSK